jgi:uncharacterized membrane protein
MRKTPRPRPVVPVSPVERVLDIAGAMFVLAAILVPLFSYQLLPKTIPSHFGFTGKSDAWGDVHLLFILPAFSLILFLALTGMRRFPHLFNYPVRITEENAARQYCLSRMFITVVKTVIAALFAWIEFQTIRVAEGKSEGLGADFLPLFLALIFGAVIVYFVSAFRSR